MTHIGIIDAVDFVRLIEDQPELYILDIRSELEVVALSLQYATTHKPLHEINPVSFPKNEGETYILCKMGPRAVALAEKLVDNGHENLIVINGGIMGCMQNGALVNKADNQPAPEEIMAAVQNSFQEFMTKNS